MTLVASGLLVRVKSFSFIDSCRKILVAVETLRVEDLLIGSVTSIATLDSGVFRMRL